eukprot:884362-Alexandrium_andersonii.AAC.1
MLARVPALGMQLPGPALQQQLAELPRQLSAEDAAKRELFVRKAIACAPPGKPLLPAPPLFVPPDVPSPAPPPSNQETPPWKKQRAASASA